MCIRDSHAAVRNIDGEYKRIEISEIDINEGRTIPADPDVRNFSYALVNGQVYYRENSVMTRPILNQTTQERIKGMMEPVSYTHLSRASGLVIADTDIRIDSVIVGLEAKLAEMELGALFGLWVQSMFVLSLIHI